MTPDSALPLREAETLIQQGISHANAGRLGDAQGCFRRAIALCPDFAQAHHNLGVAFAQCGQANDAVAALQRALELQPNYPEAHFNLANTLSGLRRRDEAIAHLRRALDLRPDYPEALSNLGLTLTEIGQPAEAAVLLRQAVRLRHDYPEAHNNLGLALADLGRFDEAAACFEQTLRINPRYSHAHVNLASTYKEQGRSEEAIACYDLALRYEPDNASTRWNRSLALLQMGNFERGWKEYEWRWKKKDARPRKCRQPLWDGSPLDGRTILLWGEQGLGDAIQFARYAPLVQARGGRVVLECLNIVRELFQGLVGVDQVVAEGPEPPAFDVHAPLMSLPFLLGTTRTSVPATVPYLTADPQRVACWRQQLAEVKGFRVGIVWQGNPYHKWDRHRSVPLWRFAALADRPGVTLVSLQKGPGVEQLEGFSRFRVVVPETEPMGEPGSFADTAALIANLDLVVTVDTAVAHLAGALGTPVWVALSALSDWRWLRDRDDSPWYPTMRLFRQPKLGDWDSVFDRLAKALATVPSPAGLAGTPSPGSLPESSIDAWLASRG
jgi:Flp pilus assembly protein TadD